jgi:hypothetical protein
MAQDFSFAEEIKTLLAKWFWGLVVIGIVGYVLWFGPTVAWYSVEYWVSPDKVYVDSKPTDCDFWRAPMGTKGCHYEEVVFAHKAMDNSKKYSWVGVQWAKKSD